jgi:hypothetical protein
MNKARRNRLHAAMRQITSLYELLDQLKDEEQEAYDNLPDSIQEGERGGIMEDAMNSIDDSMGYLEEAKDSLEEVE